MEALDEEFMSMEIAMTSELSNQVTSQAKQQGLMGIKNIMRRLFLGDVVEMVRGWKRTSSGMNGGMRLMMQFMHRKMKGDVFFLMGRWRTKMETEMKEFEEEVVQGALHQRMHQQGRNAAIKQIMSIATRIAKGITACIIKAWKMSASHKLGGFRKMQRAMARIKNGNTVDMLRSWSNRVKASLTITRDIELVTFYKQSGMRCFWQVMWRWQYAGARVMIQMWKSNMTELAMVELQGEITNVLVRKLKNSRRISAIRWH